MGLKEIREALTGSPFRDQATINQSGGTFLNLPNASIEIQSTDTAEDIRAKLANPFERKAMSITGAANLAGTIKDRINSAKARIASVSTNIDMGLGKLN